MGENPSEDQEGGQCSGGLALLGVENLLAFYEVVMFTFIFPSPEKIVRQIAPFQSL